MLKAAIERRSNFKSNFEVSPCKKVGYIVLSLFSNLL